MFLRLVYIKQGSVQQGEPKKPFNVLAGTCSAELASGNMRFTHIPTRNMLLLKTFFYSWGPMFNDY